MEDFLFANEIITETAPTLKPWKVLIVDDDPGVHDITILALKNLHAQKRPVSFTSVYSAKEARELLDNDNSFAVALIDVVMESTHAGLELTDYIRKELLNPYLRIIIRTGQSGQAPEKFVIDNYDINDYKDKTELNADALYASVKTAIDTYAQTLQVNNEKNALYQTITQNPLTSLANRHKLQSDLQKHSNLSLILLNVDRFSSINELFGYKQGNYLINEIAKTLSLLETYKCKLYHIGVDEFSLLIENANEKECDQLISTILKKFKNNSFRNQGIDFNITFTIGIVENEDDKLLDKADLAIKEARLISPNRIQRYHKHLKVKENIQDNLLWFKEIKDALAQERMVPFFQPIYNNHTHKIEKYECLVRILKDGEIIAPYKFLDVAQSTGTLVDITKVMLYKSAEFFSKNDFPFAINITSHDLKDSYFAGFVKSILEQFDIKPERLILEILENNSLDKSPESRENLKLLQELGCSVALDDFGAQCQNFSNMVDLHLNSIKIDGCFIKNLKDPTARKMVNSMVFFAEQMEIDLVAEFVSDKEIFDIVNELGIKYSQGYYISEPKDHLHEDEDPLK